MARVAPMIPDETALLCEKCGYIITGIPASSACPECGQSIAQSLPTSRLPPLWERTEGPAPVAFVATTAKLILKPSLFYRSITRRGDLRRSGRFAAAHQFLCSILFAIAAYTHAAWAWAGLRSTRPTADEQRLAIILIILFTAGTFITFIGVSWIAIRLTAWEAAYRGLRLPRDVVRRAMHYHAAHYLPVALFTLATIVGYQVARGMNPMIELHANWYLYILCAEVILAAAYLFFSYWAGMKNLMFANG